MDAILESDEGANLRAARVLICDDSELERVALSACLQSQGYDARQAASGDRALAELKSHEVDLVLLDLQMPGTSGFDVLAYLQEHRRGLPVILMTGLRPEEIQSHIHSLPNHELPPLMLKPIDLNKLLPLMDLLLSSDLKDFERAAGAPQDSSWPGSAST